MKKRTLALALIGLLIMASGAFSATFITIGSGGVGGTYYPLGGAMAEVLSNAGIDVKATSRSTSASRENNRLVAADRAQIGMSMGSALYQAINGVEAFEPDGKLPLQILMNMYPAPQHLVTVKGSGITKIEDIKGKKVSVGAPGGGDQILTMLILKAAGIDPEKDFTAQQLTQPEGVMALKDGNVDAVFWNFAAPGSAVLEVAAQRDVVLVPLSEELVQKVIADNPFLLP
ncbi:MAG: TAXI family TRAP transporter solute-binding subunit, partial [Synergistaceae bacterium]|nr:TAXI family TRAP transporter solute-binding subunit [Synergistaceae bacterium]